MADYEDYSPVVAPEEEDEKRRKFDYRPPSPLVSAGMPSPDYAAAAPVRHIGGELGAPPAAPAYAPGSEVNDAQVNPMAAPKPPRPQWGDYAPAEPHGLAKFGHVLASFFPQTNRFFNEMPEQRAEQAYKSASQEYEKNNPEIAPKEEKWSVVPGMVGPNGELVQSEATSGQIRYAPGISGVKKETQPKEGELPLGNRIAQLNQMLVDRYRVLHPGGELPQEYTIPAEATQKDYDRIDKALEAEERATGTKAQQDTTNQMRREQQAIAAENRAEAGRQRTSAQTEKSYGVQTKRLDELRKPVDSQMDRIGRLQVSLDQNSPQADALIAPELLTAMAGGQGSGLRMNEAEISRIVGGRNHWQTLKAQIDAWKTDPTKPFAITPEQRGQVRALVTAMHDKLAQKRAAVNDAEDRLTDSDDPKEHKQIIKELHRTLEGIDNQGAQGGGQGGGHVIEMNGKRYRYNGTGDTADPKNYTEQK